jgi:AcrR family transcriptional regulator
MRAISEHEAISAETEDTAGAIRERILQEAFGTFMERGFAKASMLEIATRARVSKRDLYARVGNKRDILVAGITHRAARMVPPADMPMPRDRAALYEALSAFGARILREITDGTVIGVFRLAIAEAERTPEVARALHVLAREQNRASLRAILGQAVSYGLLSGDIEEIAEQFSALLQGSLIMNLLLRVIEPPAAADLQRRARAAASAILTIYPPPSSSPSGARAA